MAKLLKWTDIWKPPFKYDHYGYVWDKDNVMTFSASDLNEENDKEIAELCKTIVAVLNGEEAKKKYSDLSVRYGCDLFKGETMIGSFRGWGHLTGGLKLDMTEAEKIQDQMITYVVERINDR